MTKNKLLTPAWILEGYDSPVEYEKAMQKNKSSTSSKQSDDSSTKGKIEIKNVKTFKVRKCPKCGSDEVGVILVGEGKKADNWECRKCDWEGKDIKEKELIEEEFIKYMNEKREGVA